MDVVFLAVTVIDWDDELRELVYFFFVLSPGGFESVSPGFFYVFVLGVCTS